jgi:hypothetical protein
MKTTMLTPKDLRVLSGTDSLDGVGREISKGLLKKVGGCGVS